MTVAAVFSADAKVHIGAGCLSEFDSHLHELADAVLVELGERIILIDLAVIVSAEELSGVVTGESEGHLSKVIGAEAEELCFLCNLVSGEAGTRDLCHGTDLVLEGDTCIRDLLVGDSDNDVLYELKLLSLSDERDHDLGNDLPVGVLLLNIYSGVVTALVASLQSQDR